MLSEAGQNLHNAEFTAGCLQHLPPQLGNELEQHVGCGVNNEKVNCGSGILAVVGTGNVEQVQHMPRFAVVAHADGLLEGGTG